MTAPSVSRFEFDRYINGKLMAEGVTIERQADLAGAMCAAARIASKGPNGETPVLVLRATPPAPTPSEDDTYLVWSNEHAAWWGPNRCGYNTHLSHAGRYTRAEAIKICDGARGGREFNRNPSEVPILLKDAEAFWTEAGLQERREREARELDDEGLSVEGFL